jgi:hypothetical protein
MNFLKKPSTWLLLLSAGCLTVVAVGVLVQALGRALIAISMAD